MTSSLRTELRSGPLYFFDQPTRRAKWTRSNVLVFNVTNRKQQSEHTLQSDQEEDIKQGESGQRNKVELSGEIYEEGKPDTSSAVGATVNPQDPDLLDAYKRAAPQILNQLAHLLSQHNWPEKRCIPRGIVNILNYSWHELTAGVVLTGSLEAAEEPVQCKTSQKTNLTLCQVPAGHKEETTEENSSAEGKVVSSERKTLLEKNPRVKKRNKNLIRARSSRACFSLSSGICPGSGWIIQPKQPFFDEPQRISLCQSVVERLQAARSPGKLQTTEQDLNTSLLLRHYGDSKAKPKDRSRKVQPAILVNGMPQIPEVKQLSPGLQKLHYRTDDGSSFIYYPSGCVAVCQSRSAPPGGGFYTNVFTDGTCPVVLATITAFGHGSVSHPLSSAITATWNPDGGFMCDQRGNVTKEWSWQTNRTPKDKIVLQLSDGISVRLFSGVSAMLTFRCDGESVQLPLHFLSATNQPKETREEKSSSGAGPDLVLLKKTKCPSAVTDSTWCPSLTSVSARRESRRLQQRARHILEDWLDYYRVAIGIKCPDVERMPDAPWRTRLRREVQSAALPSLNPPERADVEPFLPGKDEDEFQQLQRRPSAAPVEKPLDPPAKLPRTPDIRVKKDPHVTGVGPLHIHENIKLGAGILPAGPEPQEGVSTSGPAAGAPFAPRVPLTVCPTLLRAAFQGERKRSRCCCSATLMPSVTDLEYDAFVMGQPPHSQQMLVVCVTLPRQLDAVASRDPLGELYKERNRHRTMPCTQCQMDSFRLVRYEMSMGQSGCEVENTLLQQRHNAAPGMILMYTRGKLLFVGYTTSCSVRDLQKQIYKTRGNYRLGLILPSDYKFSDSMNSPETKELRNSPTLTRRDDISVTAAEEKETMTSKKSKPALDASLQRQRDISSPASPQAVVVTHRI